MLNLDFYFLDFYDLLLQISNLVLEGSATFGEIFPYQRSARWLLPGLHSLPTVEVGFAAAMSLLLANGCLEVG